MQLLKGTGVLIYDPPRPCMKNADWWIVLNVDSEICRYYRWWVDKKILNPLDFEKSGLICQSWKSHISVLRGSKPRNDKMHLWKKYHGEKIEFKYSPIIKSTDFKKDECFWYVDSWSERLNEIRQELGFSIIFNDKPIKYHITVGKECR